MKFSATDWSFLRDQDPARYYAGLVEAGVGAVEMLPAERVDLARAAGLEVINCGGPGMQQGLNRREHHAALIPAITERIAWSASVGIGQVLVFSGNRAGQSDEDGVALVAEALAPLLEQADHHGIDLLFEMLNSIDHVDYQADSCAYGLALQQRCQHPRLKLLYDIYHMAKMGEDCRSQLAQHAAVIGHIHIAGLTGRGFPGPDQAIAYPGILAAARTAGYQGWYGLEFIPGDQPLAEIAAAVQLLGR